MSDPKADRAGLSLRMDGFMRAGLEEAAKERGTSMNREILRRLERSFDAEELFADFLGGPAEVFLFTTMADAVRIVKLHAHARGLDEKQTRQAIRAAIEEVMTVHLFDGEPVKRPLEQVLFIQHGKTMDPPELPPERAGAAIALDSMVYHQDGRLDELGQTPLARRWSRPRPEDVEMVGEAEAAKLFKPSTRKPKGASVKIKPK